MQQVLVDANVFISFLVERNQRQRTSAKALIDSAGNGEIEVFITQFAVFEVTYVLQSFYGMPVQRVAELLRDMLALPGLTPIDDCPWKEIFEYWPGRLPGLADAATVAVALVRRCEAIATFDRKMIRRMQSLGVVSYW